MAITSNVIHRTFQIKKARSGGTAFTIDYEGKQYLITARHVVENITSGDEIEIFHEEQWKKMAIHVAGISAEEIDIAVLVCPVQLSPLFPMEASSGNLTYGQQIYFLGFPFGWNGGGEYINRGFPFPFVKSGIVSSLDIKPSPSRIWIDGHANRGFSGGPVVFRPNAQAQAEYKVAGVVSFYPLPTIEPVVGDDRRPIVDSHGKPTAYFSENPGFVVASDICHAVDLIRANPTGFELPRDDNPSQ